MFILRVKNVSMSGCICSCAVLVMKSHSFLHRRTRLLLFWAIYLSNATAYLEDGQGGLHQKSSGLVLDWGYSICVQTVWLSTNYLLLQVPAHKLAPWFVGTVQLWSPYLISHIYAVVPVLSFIIIVCSAPLQCQGSLLVLTCPLSFCQFNLVMTVFVFLQIFYCVYG